MSREFAVISVAAIIAGAMIVGAVTWLKCERFHARWVDSGQSERDIVRGCLVENNGYMVPEDRIWFERSPA